MCECVCGDFQPKEAYRLTDDLYLVIEEYLGCDSCGTPMGVYIHLMTRQQRDEWVPIDLVKGDLKPGPGPNDHARVVIPLIGIHELVEAARSDEFRAEFDLSDYEDLANLLHDGGLVLLQEAMERRRTRRSGEIG